MRQVLESTPIYLWRTLFRVISIQNDGVWLKMPEAHSHLAMKVMKDQIDPSVMPTLAADCYYWGTLKVGEERPEPRDSTRLQALLDAYAKPKNVFIDDTVPDPFSTSYQVSVERVTPELRLRRTMFHVIYYTANDSLFVIAPEWNPECAVRVFTGQVSRDVLPYIAVNGFYYGRCILAAKTLDTLGIYIEEVAPRPDDPQDPFRRVLPDDAMEPYRRALEKQMGSSS